MSIPRIEHTHGDYWMYKEVLTPHVWNIVNSLDDEKMSILEAIGAERFPYVEACRYRNSENPTMDVKEAFLTYEKNSSPEGPFVADSKFIFEKTLLQIESVLRERSFI